MEHLRHFGLTRDPFINDPLVNLYYASRGHANAEKRLLRGIGQQKGLCVLTGEEGTGKTMVVRHLLEDLEEDLYEACLLVPVAGISDGDWVLTRFARQLGVDEPADDRSEVLGQIYEQLAIVREDGRSTVLIIDEAQVLVETGVLAELRGLMNLEYEERRLLSLVLVGLPRLETAIAETGLDARVDVFCRLDAMEPETAVQYLNHRIRVADGNPAILEASAVGRLIELAGGAPRRLNTLADNALYEAWLAGRTAASVADVETAVADLQFAAPTPPQEPMAVIEETPEESVTPQPAPPSPRVVAPPPSPAVAAPPSPTPAPTPAPTAPIAQARPAPVVEIAPPAPVPAPVAAPVAPPAPEPVVAAPPPAPEPAPAPVVAAPAPAQQPVAAPAPVAASPPVTAAPPQAAPRVAPAPRRAAPAAAPVTRPAPPATPAERAPMPGDPDATVALSSPADLLGSEPPPAAAPAPPTPAPSPQAEAPRGPQPSDSLAAVLRELDPDANADPVLTPAAPVAAATGPTVGFDDVAPAPPARAAKPRPKPAPAAAPQPRRAPAPRPAPAAAAPRKPAVPVEGPPKDELDDLFTDLMDD